MPWRVSLSANRYPPPIKSGDRLSPGHALDIRQPALRRRVADVLGARLVTELLSAARLVGLNRFDADVELACDLLAGESDRRELEHFGLALGQVRPGDVALLTSARPK